MINIVVNVPNGAYPQPWLYSHRGNAPIINRIKMMIKIVPIITHSFGFQVYYGEIFVKINQ